MEAIIDWITLCVWLAVPFLVFGVLRPYRNWRDRPFAFALTGISAFVFMAAVMGMAIIQPWYEHMRLLAVAGFTIAALVWAAWRK